MTTGNRRGRPPRERSDSGLQMDPQTSFEEEHLSQEIEEIIEAALTDYQQNWLLCQSQEAKDILRAKRKYEKLRKDIKDVLPLDGHEHVYRVDGARITVGTERPGGPVQDRKPSQIIKIEIGIE